METLEALVKILNSHNGRDKVVRTFSYLSLYMSTRTKGSLSRNFRIISQELSYCRTVLRLFDDLPMLKYTISYGLGRQDKDIFLRVLSILNNIVDQIYFPVEHIAWAAEKKLLNASSSIWSTVGAFLWGLSSYISIMRSLIMMSILQKKTYGLKNLAPPDASLLLIGCIHAVALSVGKADGGVWWVLQVHINLDKWIGLSVVSKNIHIHENIVKEQLEHLLSAMKSTADAIIAINYLPVNSILWAGKLSSNQIGFLGVVSSLLGLILLLRNMDQLKEVA